MDIERHLSNEVWYNNKNLTFYNEKNITILELEDTFTYYNFSEEEAKEFNSKVGEFIKDAINEKLNETKSKTEVLNYLNAELSKEKEYEQYSHNDRFKYYHKGQVAALKGVIKFIENDYKQSK